MPKNLPDHCLGPDSCSPLGRLYCLINSNMLGAEETPSCKEENEHKNPNSNTEREVWWEVVNNAKPFKERVVKKRGNTMHYGEEE